MIKKNSKKERERNLDINNLDSFYRCLKSSMLFEGILFTAIIPFTNILLSIFYLTTSEPNDGRFFLVLSILYLVISLMGFIINKKNYYPKALLKKELSVLEEANTLLTKYGKDNIEFKGFFQRSKSDIETIKKLKNELTEINKSKNTKIVKNVKNKII